MKTTEKRALGPAIITIKTDPETKRAFQQYAASMHVPLSTMLIGSGWQTIRQGSVTFQPVEYMTPKLERSLAKIEEDIKHGRNMSPVLSTPAEIDAYLDDLMRQSAHARSASQNVRKRVR